MHAADFSLGILGANAHRRRGRGDRHRRRVGAAPAGPRHRSRSRFFGDGAVNEGDAAGGVQPGRAVAGAGDLRLREQRLRHHACRSRGAVAGSITGRAEAFGIPAVTRRRPGPGGGADAATARRSTGPGPAAGPTFLECTDLPLRRPPHLRAHGPAATTARPRRSPPGRSRDPVEIQGARLTAADRARDRRRGRGAARRGGRVRAGQRRTRTRPTRSTTCTPAACGPDGGALMPKLSYLQGAEPGARRRDGPTTRRCSCSARTSGSARRNVTTGLLARFGPERVLDTPLSEQAFTSFATGAALAGHAAGDRVPDPVAAVPGLRADRQPGAQVLADDRRPVQGAGHLPRARARARGPAGPGSTPTTRTACSPTSG